MGGTVLQQTLPDDDQTLNLLIRQTFERMNQPHARMYSPEEVTQRREQNDREYALGLAGMLSGSDTLAQAGGLVLKNALEGRKPKATDHGVFDPITGEHRYDPDYLQQQEQAKLTALYQFQAAQALKKQQFQQHDETIRAIAAGHDAARSTAQADAAAGKVDYDPYGLTNDGRRVVTEKKTAMQYIMDLDPATGKPTYTPYMGVSMPNAVVEKNLLHVQDALSSLKRTDKLMEQVEANKDAFGLTGALMSKTPTFAQGYVAPWVGLTPKMLEARADILRNAAMEIHNLYGAALSMGEEKRANTFLVNEGDQPEMIMAKLKSAREWAQEKAQQYGPMLVNLSNQRANPNPAPQAPAAAPQQDQQRWTPTPAAGLSPAEMAERDALRKRLQQRLGTTVPAR